MLDGAGADAMSVRIEGRHCTPTPPPPPLDRATPSNHVTPIHSKRVPVEQEMTLSSDELDRKIQGHLEAKATEWCVCVGSWELWLITTSMPPGNKAMNFIPHMTGFVWTTGLKSHLPRCFVLSSKSTWNDDMIKNFSPTGSNKN